MISARATYHLASAAAAILALPAIVGGCLVINLANPFVFGMIGTWHISNDTNEELEVIPISEVDGQLRVLYSGVSSWLALPGIRGPRYSLRPGDRISVHEIDDRGRLAGVVIQRRDGIMLYLDWDSVRPDPRTVMGDIELRTLAIKDLEGLEPPSRDVIQLTIVSDWSAVCRIPVSYLIYLSPFLFVYCLRVRRKAERAANSPGTPNAIADVKIH